MLLDRQMKQSAVKALCNCFFFRVEIIFECTIAIVCDLAPMDTLLPFVAWHLNFKSST